MIFFADENFAINGVRVLDAFDRVNEIRHLTDSMNPGTPDEEWLVAIASLEPKPIVLSGDGRILRNKAQRKVLRSSGLTFVHLSSGWTNLPWDEMAWKLVKVWPAIVRNVDESRAATVFEVKPTTQKVYRVGLTAHL